MISNIEVLRCSTRTCASGIFTQLCERICLCTLQECFFGSLNIFRFTTPSCKSWCLQCSTIAERQSPWLFTLKTSRKLKKWKFVKKLSYPTNSTRQGNLTVITSTSHILGMMYLSESLWHLNNRAFFRKIANNFFHILLPIESKFFFDLICHSKISLDRVKMYRKLIDSIQIKSRIFLRLTARKEDDTRYSYWNRALKSSNGGAGNIFMWALPFELHSWKRLLVNLLMGQNFKSKHSASFILHKLLAFTNHNIMFSM